jgi:hypothetical protein
MANIVLDYSKAHEFVEKNKKHGFFWDGYTILKWSRNDNGYMQKNGMFRNNKWGYVLRYKLKNNGTWEVSDKYDKYN